MRAAVGRICGAVAVLAACLAPNTALASTAPEPGVQVDPGSPAAKQYVLQLGQARQTGTQGAHSSSSAAPFGAGITPPGGGSSGASGQAGTAPEASSGRRHPGVRRAAGGHSTSGPAAPVPLPPAVLRAARAQGSTAGSGSWLALVGGGVAILLLGGFGGTVLRHSRRPRPSS
jgi:hypothetical protein